MCVKLTYDPAKNTRNIAERELSFEYMLVMDLQNAIYLIDNRQAYSEIRHLATGYLEKRLHVLCYIKTTEEMRIIGFRRANKQVAKKYGKSQIIDQ